MDESILIPTALIWLLAISLISLFVYGESRYARRNPTGVYALMGTTAVLIVATMVSGFFFGYW